MNVLNNCRHQKQHLYQKVPRLKIIYSTEQQLTSLYISIKIMSEWHTSLRCKTRDYGDELLLVNN